MPFEINNPTPEYTDYINRRVIQTEKNKGYDLRVDLRWISAARSLVTTKALAQRFVERFVHYQIIADILKDQLLAREVQLALENAGPWLQQFNDKTYNPMDTSPTNVAACNNAFQNLIPDLSRLTDEEVIASIFKDVQELQTRVSVNGMLQGKKSPGLMSLFKPKIEMRPDIIRLIENLAAVKTVILEPASRILNSEASKN
jgi:hypothetical protein